MNFDNDIFVIDCWVDNETKEKDLINLINRLKIFNIPILLTGHYPVSSEIQKMVDYYLYDKNNPLLNIDEINEYKINNIRWSEMGDIRIENQRKFHHDYSIWETMRNSFNFCKYLKKEYIHFIEYDCLPDEIQYRQAFIEEIRRHDIVIYEYEKGSTLVLPHPFCASYIFSIRTDIAVKVIDTIKNKDEFFKDKPDNWQLEKNFLSSIKKITDKIFISRYTPNNNELNIRSVWERDNIYRNGINIQFYLVIDDLNDFYLHIISGGNYLIEINYLNYKKFIKIKKNNFLIEKLGKYERWESVKIYYEGIEIFNEVLSDDITTFKSLNKLSYKNKTPIKPKEVNINFIDGPFVEIKESIEKKYNVQFINSKNNKIEFEINLNSNHWARASKKYYIDWIIKITDVDNSYEHIFNLTNKRVLITFESKSLGDTLAWIPYIEKFRTDKNCHIICSTFHNDLFEKEYPKIEFVKPGSVVYELYALYKIGLFNEKDGYNQAKHPYDPKKEPLAKIASDILGLEYVEIKPKLPLLSNKKKKMVSIGFHGTAQCKYWNNPNGWQEVVNFLIDNEYEVKLLSNEGYEYMGNKAPKGVTKCDTKTIEDAIKVVQESELFIGISSGLAWLAWGCGTETILISGFTDEYTEPIVGIRRIINKDVCNSCWNEYIFDPGDWNWCPVHKGTERQFECSKTISSELVINEIKSILNL